MNINYENTKDNIQTNLSVAEIDPLIANLDIDELTAGVYRGLEDFKHGRYSHFRTSMERIRKEVFRRLNLFTGGHTYEYK